MSDEPERIINLDHVTRHIPSPFDAGRLDPPTDPTPDNPHARGRARRIPTMGGQPVIKPLVTERPEMVDNPVHAGFEPVTIETQRRPLKPDYARTTVRRVVHAELDELIEWGLPRFQKRFPRCTGQALWPMLAEATKGGTAFFVRTDSVCALFIAIRTPEEPELAVRDVFVVKKRDGMADDERDAIYRAGLAWAKQIDAVSYTYGSSTGAKLDDVEKVIGHDIKNISYTVILR
jgi:hypothetical protein